METWIAINNGLTVLALLAFGVLVLLVAKEGQDERSRWMGFKLFRFLFLLLLGGLAAIILVTGWVTVDYETLRSWITLLMSLVIFAGLGYWLYLRNKL